MKVILNGATSGSNFGDYLFAQLFQDHLSRRLGKENVYWYRSRYAMSEYYAKRLDNRKECDLGEMDALVYISGGYFCGDDANWKDTVRRYLRYFILGDRCIAKKIPYAIVGVEVGIPKSRIMRAVQKRILKNASLIVVRNGESLECLRSMGINDAICTTDTAFSIEPEFFADRTLPAEIAECDDKLLLFHIYPGRFRNERVTEKIVPVINAFIKEHPEYKVLIAADQTSPEMESELSRISEAVDGETLIYKYDDPIELCALIDKVDLVVTPKLHVGILGARLGKSVISFCNHAEKITRLYSHLGESGRTLALSELTVEKGLAMMEEYYLTPMSVSEEITELACSNFKYLDDFITDVAERSK